MSLNRWCLGVVLALVACQPNPPAPVKVMVVTPSTTGNYEPREVELKTISSIANLQGTVATLVGGARVVLDDNDPLLTGSPTDAQLLQIFEKDPGGDVRANFISKGDVLWPADFHSWSMVTTYYNFETSFNYYQKIYDGAKSDSLLGNRVLYWASLRDIQGSGDVDVKDNAFFLSIVQAFAILPFDKLQKIPFSLNVGVVGHEFGHRVFNQKVYGGRPIPDALGSWSGTGLNLLKAIDEGFSDFHGWGVTCDAAGPGCRPDFLAASIDDQAAIDARDISKPDKCLSTELRNQFITFLPSQWLGGGLQYRYATLIAAALYQAANQTGKIDEMQKSLLLAYDDETLATPGLKQIINGNINTEAKFTPEAFANVLVSHVTDPDLKKTLCNELSDRLQVSCASFPCTEMPACPATSSRGTTSCMTLPPP